jgi:hypothetical protein
MFYLWGLALATVVVVVVLCLAVYFAIWGEEIEIDFKSLPPAIRFRGRRK